jgi:hypothetical protein
MEERLGKAAQWRVEVPMLLRLPCFIAAQFLNPKTCHQVLSRLVTLPCQRQYICTGCYTPCTDYLQCAAHLAPQAGCTAMSEALKVAGSMPGGSDPTWRSMLSAESAALTAMAARIDRDRVKVAMQPMPRTTLALPEPKVLVGAALAHAPPTYTPPPPPPEAERQAQGQSCCVQ